MNPQIAVVLTDVHQKILWANDRFMNMTGYSLAEMHGKKPGRLLQGPDTEEQEVLRIRQALQLGIPIEGALTNYRKNGEKYLCKIAIHPIFDEEQQLTHFIAFEEDLSTTVAVSLDQHPRYQTSSLKGIAEIRLYKKLKELVENNRLYLDPNLSLRKTAERLETNTKYLSQVVNHYSGHNFQYFINCYRINEVKKIIRNNDFQHLTLYGIALQCGFKNKSTFYKVFKEITGLTPKAYLEND